MSLAEAWQNIEQHVKSVAESAAARIEGDLPAVAHFVQEASSNPVLLALAQAEHLNALPEGLTLAANFIQGLEASLAAAKAAGAAEAQAAAQTAMA